VQRYLADEPVLACPPSAAYRFRKFARRNKAMLVTVAAISVALLLGTGVSVWQAVEARHARGLADEGWRTRSESMIARRNSGNARRPATAKPWKR
jgi:eukaryotic-like serine/threonine-protein kinase